MPLFKGTITTSYGVGNPLAQWKNIVTLSAADLDTAWSALDTMALDLPPVYNESLSVTNLFVTTIPPGGGYKNVSVNYPGTRATTGDLLPFWLACRVDFLDTAGSRPERKYFRVGLTEDDILGTILDPSIISLLQALGNSWATNGNYVGPTGEAHSSATVFQPIQMRQQHWHRRFKPGFHRAYVPNA